MAQRRCRTGLVDGEGLHVHSCYVVDAGSTAVLRGERVGRNLGGLLQDDIPQEGEPALGSSRGGCGERVPNQADWRTSLMQVKYTSGVTNNPIHRAGQSSGT